MKKIFTLLSIALTLSTSAQITIVRSDYGSIGDKVRFAVDTPPASSLNSTILTTGASQTWNFSTGLAINKYDSNVFVSPSTVATPPDSANLLIVSANNYQFQNVDANFVKIVLDRPNYNIKNVFLKIFQFPFSYGSVLVDSLNYLKAGTPADFNMSILTTFGYDSLKAVIRGYDSSICVGWGTINLPDTSCAVLQLKSVAMSNIYLYGRNIITGWSLINSLAGVPVHQKNVEYQWIGKNSKSYVARASMDSNGVSVQSFTYRVRSVMVPIVKNITPANGMQQHIINDTINATINTSNSHFTQGSNIFVSLTRGTNGLQINSITTANDTTLTAKIIVKPTDSLGFYTATITDPVFGNFSLANAFQVTISTGINEQQNILSSINIYPNPANDVLNISLSQQNISSATIFVFDITGRMIKSVIINKNSTSVDVSDLNNGVYFVTVLGKYFTASKKVIINK